MLATKWINAVFNIGSHEEDNYDEKRRIRLTNIASLISLVIAATHGAISFYFGYDNVGITNLFYVGFYLIPIVLNALGRTLTASAFLVIGASLGILKTSIAYGEGTGIYHYFLIACLAPFLFFPASKRPLIWLCTFIALICFSAFLINSRFNPPIYVIEENFLGWFRFFSILTTMMLSIFIVYTFHKQKTIGEKLLRREQEKTELLLHNMLPASVAERLKHGMFTIADEHKEVTILFCDMVDFTKMSRFKKPDEVVLLLNELFQVFDYLIEKHGCEKMRTVGDAYMIAGGVPEALEKHMHHIAALALDMMDAANEMGKDLGLPITLRIGIESGPVIAGVIGQKRFMYDIWGDAVSLASRMESHGVAGRIQVTEKCYEVLKNDFDFEERGDLEVKSFGKMKTYFLLGHKSNAIGA